MRACTADVHPGHVMCSSVHGASFRRCAGRKGSFVAVRPSFFQILGKLRIGIVTLLRL